MGAIYRYEIGDSVCGVLDWATKRRVADLRARALQAKHPECKVTIFDRMAHKGRPDTWAAAGPVLSTRTTRP